MENGAVFQKSAWRSIFSLSIPALISILVMMLYNMADMYFIGMLGDVSQVAAVSLAMPVYSILMAVSTMIGNGGCTRIAQALGEQDLEQVRRCTSICIWASIVFGAVFAVICFLVCDPLLLLLGANEDMWVHTRSYVLILAAGAPLILANQSIGGALRGEGEVNAGVIGGLISTLANILLDPLFILVLKLGAGGAAAATVLGNACAIGYYLIYRSRHKSHCILALHPQYARDPGMLGSILVLGLPNAVSSVLSGFAGTFSNRLLAGYGTSAVAAMAAAGKAVMAVSMIQMGICMGIQPMLAYCHGARDWPRLKEIVQKILLLTVGLGVALTVLIWFARGPLIGLFIKDAEVAALGKHLTTYMLFMGPFIGIYYLAVNFLQSGGHALGASVASTLRQGVLLIPALHLMNRLLGLEGLALASAMSDSIAILITGAAALHCYHKAIR